MNELVLYIDIMRPVMTSSPSSEYWLGVRSYDTDDPVRLSSGINSIQRFALVAQSYSTDVERLFMLRRAAVDISRLSIADTVTTDDDTVDRYALSAPLLRSVEWSVSIATRDAEDARFVRIIAAWSAIDAADRAFENATDRAFGEGRSAGLDAARDALCAAMLEVYRSRFADAIDRVIVAFREAKREYQRVATAEQYLVARLRREGVCLTDCVGWLLPQTVEQVEHNEIVQLRGVL